MEITTEATLLTAESKPYSIGGNDGVSHRIRFAVEGEIYVCKSTASQITEMAGLRKKTGTAVFRLTSRKETLGLELVSFEA